MLFEAISGLVTLAVLLIASYTDLKTREVPDWLSYGFILSILGLRIIFSLEYGWNFLLSGFLGILLFFLLGALLYYTHQWGGADSKILMGMGGVLGLPIPLQSTTLNPFWFFLLLLFVGAIYGLFWMGMVALRERKVVGTKFSQLIKEWKNFHFLAIGTSFFFLLITFVIPIFWPFVFIPLGVFYLLISVAAVEKSCFYRRVLPAHITEGDWLAEVVTKEGKLFLRKKALGVEDILKLRKYFPTRKMLIKDGIPFLPSFLLAFFLFWLAVGLKKFSLLAFLGLR